MRADVSILVVAAMTCIKGQARDGAKGRARAIVLVKARDPTAEEVQERARSPEPIEAHEDMTEEVEVQFRR